MCCRYVLGHIARCGKGDPEPTCGAAVVVERGDHGGVLHSVADPTVGLPSTQPRSAQFSLEFVTDSGSADRVVRTRGCVQAVVEKHVVPRHASTQHASPYLQCASNQSNTVLCHCILFCGFNTQWFSSGKRRNCESIFLACNAVNTPMPWSNGMR